MISKIDANYILPKYYDNWHCPWQLPLCRRTFLLRVGRFHAKISQTSQNPCHPYISLNFCKRTILLYTYILSKSFMIYTEKNLIIAHPFRTDRIMTSHFSHPSFPPTPISIRRSPFPETLLRPGWSFLFFALKNIFWHKTKKNEWKFL